MVFWRIASVAFVVAAATAAQAQSEVYRWVDKDGKVHFSDAPPPEDASQVTQKRVGTAAPDDTQLPYATQVAMRRSPVVLYASPNCGELCASGRELLQSRGIPYSEKNAATPTEAENLKKLAGAAEVPVLMVGDTPIRGFSDTAWHGALDAAGYPRTRIPGQGSPKPPPPVSEAAPAPPQGETAK
jgi:glutaredoxin